LYYSSSTIINELVQYVKRFFQFFKKFFMDHAGLTNRGIKPSGGFERPPGHPPVNICGAGPHPAPCSRRHAAWAVDFFRFSAKNKKRLRKIRLLEEFRRQKRGNREAIRTVPVTRDSPNADKE
jgi:hypothetical protein